MPSEIFPPHRFGGSWTSQKLEVLGNYLRAYTTALAGKPHPREPFRKAYIDGFAGTGSRVDSQGGEEEDQEVLDLGEADPELRSGLLDGSARVALNVEPGFDRYIFIEESQARCKELAQLEGEFPGHAGRIWIKQGEANAEIRHLCMKDWSGSRAVLFLDPYGLQVEWATLEAIADTRAIDLWLLFPLWMGVNRVVTKSGRMLPGWAERLTTLLGDESWREEFYRIDDLPNLFGDVDQVVTKVSTDVIGRRFLDRLRRIFPGVAENPGVLRNSRNSPIYLLCFAAANERGAPTALRIARHLLQPLR